MARSLVTHRRLCLVLLALITIAAAWRAAHLELDFSFRNFFLAERRKDPVAAAFAARFHNAAGSYLVAVLQGDDVFRGDVLAAVEEMSDQVETIPHVERVYSLATVPYIHGDLSGLSLEPLSELLRRGANPAALKVAVLSSPLYVRRLVSPDGRATALLALLEDRHRSIAARAPTIAAFRQVVTRRLPRGFTALFTGYPVAEAAYAQLAWRGFLAAEAAGVAVMAAALFTCLHTLAGVVLPLAAVSIATVWTLGFMEVSGQRITLTNAGAPLMVLVIGVAELCFFMSRYYEEAARGELEGEVVTRAVGGTIPPALFAAITTSVGFLSLLTGHIRLTRDFGVTMAVGIAATFVVSLLLIPGSLAALAPPPPRAVRPVGRGPVAALLSSTATFNAHHPWVAVAGAIALFGLGTAGGSYVNLDQYATGELPPGHPVRQAQKVADSSLTGAFATQVGIRARDGGTLTRPALLRQVEALEEFLAAQPHVVKAWSVVDYLKELNMAAHGGRPDLRRLPDEADLASQYLLLLSSGGRTSDIATLVDPTHRWATIVLGTTDLGTGELLALRERTRAFIRTHLGSNLDFRFMGDYWLISTGTTSLVRDLASSMLASFAVVFVLVGLFLRSWRLTLISIPPNILPLAAAVGLMGVAAFPLRVGTSMILPVSLGIAVDSTIHYLARLREEWAAGADHGIAVRRALLGTGRGMVFSTVVLVSGFLCFLIPQFLVFHHIGLLAAWALFIALLADLFLVPSLLVLLRPPGRAPRTAPDPAVPPSHSGAPR